MILESALVTDGEVRCQETLWREEHIRDMHDRMRKRQSSGLGASLVPQGLEQGAVPHGRLC